LGLYDFIKYTNSSFFVFNRRGLVKYEGTFFAQMLLWTASLQRLIVNGRILVEIRCRSNLGNSLTWGLLVFKFKIFFGVVSINRVFLDAWRYQCSISHSGGCHLADAIIVMSKRFAH